MTASSFDTYFTPKPVVPFQVTFCVPISILQQNLVTEMSVMMLSNANV